MEELKLEEEALFINQEMLTEVKDLIDDINDTKLPYLREFIHPHWGSIVGNENDIRVAVLKDEVEIWEQRVGNDPDTIPYLGYIRDTLKGRMKELTEEKNTK